MTSGAVSAPRVPLPRSYLVWVGAATVSNVGVAALYFALGWAASAHGGSAAGLVITVLVGTWTVLLLVGGAIADRVGARAVMIAGDTALLMGTTALAVTTAVIGTPLWLLLGAAVVEGAVTAFYLPAEGSMPRHLVWEDQVSRAVALRGAGGELADLVGGPLGGVLVAAAASPWPSRSTRSPTHRSCSSSWAYAASVEPRRVPVSRCGTKPAPGWPPPPGSR